MNKFYQIFKKILRKRYTSSLLAILFLFMATLINLRYFFQPGIFRGHDLEIHLARIANYYLAIKGGHFPPRWAPNLNFKFGYPVFNYNYPLANILAYPLIVIGFNLEDSLKIILFSAYFFTGLFMFLWIKKHFSATSSFVAAIFYLCAPYLFLDLYVRGSVGEIVSFALLPAVLYFLTLLSQKINRKRFFFLVLSIAMFSLSHNLMVLIFTPAIFLYFIYLARRGKYNFLKTGGIGIILGFLLTSFFWIPAFFESNFITLNAYDLKTFYLDHFPTFKQLIDSNWQYGFSVPGDKDTMSFQLGAIHWVVILLSLGIIILNLIRKNKEWRPDLIMQIGFWLAIFLMLPLSIPLWKLLPVLGYIQYPWRILALAIFICSLIAASLTEKYKIIGFLLMIICFINVQQFIKPFLWDKQSDMTYYDYLFTTSVRHENMPIWFQENKSDQFQPRFLSDSGLVKFTELSWKAGKHVYEINSPSDTYIWEHTAYFPGWEVYINGKKTTIQFNNKDYPGLIGLKVPAGKHLITTIFTENTKARILGDLLSIFSVTIILVFLIKILKNEKNI